MKIMDEITISEWGDFLKRDYVPEVSKAFLRKYDYADRNKKITYQQGMSDLASILNQLGHNGRAQAVKMG